MREPSYPSPMTDERVISSVRVHPTNDKDCRSHHATLSVPLLSWKQVEQNWNVLHAQAEENYSFCSLLLISKQCPATSQEAGFQHMWWLLGQTNIFPFGQQVSAITAVSLPKILPTPSLLMGSEMLGRQHLHCASNSQNIAVLSTSFQQPVESTALRGLLWGKSTLSQPDSIQAQRSNRKLSVDPR